MSQRNPDLVASIMVAVSCLLVAACLAVVLLTPGEWFPGRRAGLIAALLFVFGIPILLRVAERSRIRAAVREKLGTVVRLRRLPFWRQGWDFYFYSTVAPKYEVIFSDFDGHEFRGLCRSSFLHGVDWLQMEPLNSLDSPPP